MASPFKTTVVQHLLLLLYPSSLVRCYVLLKQKENHRAIVLFSPLRSALGSSLGSGPSLGGLRCHRSVQLRAPTSGDRDAAAPSGSEAGGQFLPSPSIPSPPSTSRRRSVRIRGLRPVSTFALHPMSTDDLPPSSDIDAIILRHQEKSENKSTR